MKSETEERTEQVRQQDAYPANAWGGSNNNVQHPAFPFSRATFPSLIVCLYLAYSKLLKQEAQLSQRDRATLRVIEYFAKSLKITQGHSK